MLPRQGPLAGRSSFAPEAGGLPVSLTRLVGRGRELDELLSLCASQRLLTLIGAGGSGKTRLAAEVAQRRLAWAGEVVTWVELSSCSDPALVAQQVAASLALRETAERETVDAIVSVLCGERLLVLDNCEHVIDGAAGFAAEVLSQCPRVRIMTTSREPLGIAGERIWLVPPLEISTEAVELFIDRAVSADPSFEVDGTNASVIEEICRRLDGIPLAIELAAARVRVLTPAQIAERLEDRFSILSGGSRSSIPRHRTLRAAIDWSFNLLTPIEQTLLERLSVFSGSFSLEAVEAVCTDQRIEKPDVLDLLSELVDKSLVTSNTRNSAARYWLLESIREYGRNRLSSDAREELQRRHAEAFLDLAERAVPELMEASVSCLAKLDADHDNIRAALTWGLERDPDRIALPLTAAFRWYWYYRISWSEGLRWITRALEASSDSVSAARAATLTGAGALTGYMGDIDRGRRYLEQAAAMWRDVGDERHLAYTLSALAHLLALSGEIERAHLLADEGLTLVRRAGTSWDLGYVLTNAASFVAQTRGDLEEADRHLEEAERIWAADEHPLGFPFVLNARALMALRRNDSSSATRFARAALERTRQSRDLWFSSRSLRVIACTSDSDPALAAKLIAASDAMLRSIAAGILPYERDLQRNLMKSLEERLTPDELRAALDEGSRMSFDEACDASLSAVQSEKKSIHSTDLTRPLHVRDLGALQILIAGEPLALEARASGRARELLVFLLQHPSGCTREEVGVALWPDASTDAVKNSFHVTLHRLRKMLGKQAVRTEDGRYWIEIPHEVDSRRFEREVNSALRLPETDPARVGRLEEAISLYTGDFLQGEEVGDWCLVVRGHLRGLFFKGLFALGQQLEAAGRFAEAADAYARLLAREPLHEAACRQLMICHARTGARLQSMKIYRKFEQQLRDDLSASPEAETSALFLKLKQNEMV